MVEPDLPTRDDFLLNCITTIDICAICLESFDSNHTPAHFISPRYCKHVSGEACLRQWVSTSDRCPTCRCELYRSASPSQNRQQQNSPPLRNTSQTNTDHIWDSISPEALSDHFDNEPEYFLEDLSRELKGEMIAVLYTETCQDRSTVIDAIYGNTMKMRQCLIRVLETEPTGRYSPTAPHSFIEHLRKIEITILGILLRTINVERGLPLSASAIEWWTDEMCVRIAYSDIDEDLEYFDIVEDSEH